MKAIAERLIKQHKIQDSFYVIDMQKLRCNIGRWRTLLPRVTPFYAVKCNPDPKVLHQLSKYNDIGFDCASKQEIDSVLSLGVQPSRLIFAHPCKKPTDITFANEKGVGLSVFDNGYELLKMAERFPNMEALLRIRVHNPGARVQLGKKYGADPEECDALIRQAHRLGIRVRGVSFHIGSASQDPSAFSTAITHAKDILAKYPLMDTLDIGGGFQKDNFEACAQIIAKKTADMSRIRIMAEPGRYMVEDVYTFFSPIIGKRRKHDSTDYWISDGLYGSMNCILYDKHSPNYEVLRNPNLPTVPMSDEDEEDATIWGSTCDSADLVLERTKLSRSLRIGDFLMFKDFGAYTLAGACNFNGIDFTNPLMFYINTESSP